MRCCWSRAARSEATGKLFEYLASGRPILAFAAGTAADDIVASAGAGIAIPVGDPAAAESAVRTLLTSGLPATSDDAGNPYAYSALAAKYEDTIEATIRRAGR